MTDTTTEAVETPMQDHVDRALSAMRNGCNMTLVETTGLKVWRNVPEGVCKALAAERDALQAQLDAATGDLSTISVRMELTADELQGIAIKALTAIKGGRVDENTTIS